MNQAKQIFKELTKWNATNFPNTIESEMVSVIKYQNIIQYQKWEFSWIMMEFFLNSI